MGNLKSIQSDYVHEFRSGTGSGEDVSYYDITLSSPVDITKSIVKFDGGFCKQTTGVYGGEDYFADVTSRFINSTTIRLSSRYDDGYNPGSPGTPGYYFIGRWRVTEVHEFGSGTLGLYNLQQGFIKDEVVNSGGYADGLGEDARYYDIDLTSSPYVPMDPDKTIPIFQGSIYAGAISYIQEVGAFDGNSQALITTMRLVDSGETLRISTAAAMAPHEPSMITHAWVNGWWQLMEFC